MAYTKKTWVDGEIITAEELNRVESYLNTFNADPDPIISLDFKIVSNINEDVEAIACTLNRVPKYVMIDLNRDGVPDGSKFSEFSNFDTCFCSNIFADRYYKSTINQSDTLDIKMWTNQGLIPSSNYSEFTKIEEGIYRSDYIGKSSNPELEYVIIDTTVIYRWDHALADVYLKYSENYRHDKDKHWLEFCNVIIPFNKEYLKALNSSSNNFDEEFIDNLDFEIYNKILVDTLLGISTLTNQETLNEYLNRRNEIFDAYSSSLSGSSNMPEDLTELYNKLNLKFPINVLDNKLPSSKDLWSWIISTALETTDSNLALINSDRVDLNYLYNDKDLHKTVINDSYIMNKYIENDQYMYDDKDYTDTVDYLFYFMLSETYRGVGAYSVASCNTIVYDEINDTLAAHAGNLNGDAVIIYGLYNSETDTISLYRSVHEGISFTPNFKLTVSNTISEAALSFDVAFEDFYGNRFNVENTVNNTGLELRVYGAAFINLKPVNGIKFLKLQGYYHLNNNFYQYDRYSTIGQNGNMGTLDLQSINVVNIPNENNRNIENLSRALIQYIGNNIQYFKYLSNTADTYNNSTYFTYPKVELGEDLT